MDVLKNSRVVCFDIDDTLVMWGRTTADNPDGMKFVCPPHSYTIKPGVFGSQEEEAKECGGWIEYLIPHKKHIAALKEHALRGHAVCVWSQGGWAWAASVVRTLGLEQYVTLVMDKPMWAYDDKKPEEYMPKSQWIDDKE